MTRARSHGGRQSLACSHPRVRSSASRSRPGCTTAREARSGPSGYFALPILYGDRLAGKLDATADRKAGVLRVNAINQDETFYKASAGNSGHLRADGPKSGQVLETM
jgi:Winged helix DNA-binding domain